MSRTGLGRAVIFLGAAGALAFASTARGGEDGPVTTVVFDAAADGFGSVRIPSIVATRRGALLAFAEGRAANTDQARNKILLKRSDDGGTTWGRAAVIADGGDRSLNNPCAVVERASGRVLLMYQSYPAGIAERSPRIQTGLDGPLIVRNHLIEGDDEGRTWSPPRDVTRQTKRPTRVTTMAVGPGLGVQLTRGPHAGRLVFPFNEGPYGLWNIYAVYSDDQGRSWALGANAPGGLIDAPKPRGGKISTVNEAQLAERNDGSLLFNVRRWAGGRARKTSISRDGGATWSAVADVPELIEPGCMASIFRYTWPDDRDGPGGAGRSRILYSGPIGDRRARGTVFLSYDEGATWPVHRVLCEGGFAYSCLARTPDGAIGCLYEPNDAKRILFARFDLEWLTRGNDRPGPSQVGRRR